MSPARVFVGFCARGGSGALQGARASLEAPGKGKTKKQAPSDVVCLEGDFWSCSNFGIIFHN